MDQPVLLFDGVCNLCNASVQFIIRHDPEGRVRFASLQSEAAHRLLARPCLEGKLLDSVVLVEGARAYVRSEATLRTARHLAWPWSLLALLVVVPRPIRDWGYDLIARHRYRWFGRRQSCMIPTAALRSRFLE